MAAGTFKKAVFDGLSLNIFATNAATLMGGNFENEPIPHSGGNAQKKTRRANSMTSFDFYTTAAEHEQLQELNDRTEAFPVSLVDINDNTFRANGFINYQGRTVDENKSTVDIHPENKKGFTLFQG